MTAQPRAALTDIALERRVIGGLVAHSMSYGRVGSTLSPEHFTEAANVTLFKIIRHVAERDGRVTAMAVRAALEVDDNGGSSWRDNAILTLIDHAPLDPAEVEALAGALVEVWARRKSVQVAGWILDETKRAYTSPFEITRDAMLLLEEVVSTGGKARATTALVGDTAVECLKDLETDTDNNSVTTGFADLDRYLGGYVPGRLIVLAGRPGMGKSTLAPSSARQAARSGAGVFYASLEMTKKELTARLLTDAAWTRETPIPYEHVLKKRLQMHEKERLRTILPKIQELPFIIDDQSGLTVDELQGRARRAARDMAKKGQKLSLVVVDHLGLLKQDAHLVHNQTRAIGEIARKLKLMAKELDVCVLALCQLNRGVEGREDKRPTKADLRQSGEIEENADQVLILYREAYYLAKRQEQDAEAEVARLEKLQRISNDLEIIIDKNRHGQEAMVPAWADMGACAVRNAAYGGRQ